MTSERPCPSRTGRDTWSGLSRLTAQAAQVLEVSGRIEGGESGRAGPGCDDGTSLRDSLQAELGGLRAAIDYVIGQNGLDWTAVNQQRDRKRALYERGARESNVPSDHS